MTLVELACSSTPILVIMIIIAYRTSMYILQKLQMARHAVHDALGPQNAQHRRTATGNLCPARVLDGSRAKPQADRLRLQEQQLILRLNLQGDLGLTAAFPPAQDGRVGRVREEVFVAGERGMGALGGDFSCKSRRKVSFNFFSNGRR